MKKTILSILAILVATMANAHPLSDWEFTKCESKHEEFCATMFTCHDKPVNGYCKNAAFVEIKTASFHDGSLAIVKIYPIYPLSLVDSASSPSSGFSTQGEGYIVFNTDSRKVEELHCSEYRKIDRSPDKREDWKIVNADSSSRGIRVPTLKSCMTEFITDFREDKKNRKRQNLYNYLKGIEFKDILGFEPKF